MTGVFHLQHARDLLAKLGRERDRLRVEPLNEDHAFNYFVTAEHMVDWFYPGDTNRLVRESERNKTVLRRIAWDVASGAKHFVPHRYHVTVLSAGIAVYPGSVVGAMRYGRDRWGTPPGDCLVVVLSEAAAKEAHEHGLQVFGIDGKPVLSVLHAAEWLTAEWERALLEHRGTDGDAGAEKQTDSPDDSAPPRQ